MSIALNRPRVLALVASAAAFGGAAVAAPAANAAPITGVSTAVAADPGLVAGLTSLGATVRLTGAATADSSGRFVYPVIGGSLTADLKGKVNHTGGLEIKAKSGIRFGIQQFVIDTTKTPVLTAVPTVAGYPLGIRVPVADITDVTVSSAPPATVVSGTLKLTDIGALYINTFLGKSVVKKGTVFGTAQASVTLGS